MSISPRSASFPILGACQATGVSYRLGLAYVEAWEAPAEVGHATRQAIINAHGGGAFVAFVDLIGAAFDEGRLKSPRLPLSVDISHLSPTQQADIVAHVAGLSDAEEDTYVPAFDGWQCFHCGQVFRTARGARLHFGEQPVRPPLCIESAAEVARLQALLNTPEVEDFVRGVMLEAPHQRERWGASHDAGKTPLDWFWLIGFLAQKAAFAQIEGDRDKALHHCISTAAALANWHSAIGGQSTVMRPGIETPTGEQP